VQRLPTESPVRGCVLRPYGLHDMETAGGSDEGHEFSVVPFAEPCTYCLYWMNLEIAIGIVATCLPTLPGLRKISPVNPLVNSARGIFLRGPSSSAEPLHLGGIFKSPEEGSLHQSETRSIIDVVYKPGEIVVI
jgi:hypothetical protein